MEAPGSCSRDSHEESTDHERLDVFGNSNGGGKDGEAEVSKQEGKFAASKLRQRSPKGGTDAIANKIESAGQGSHLNRDVEVFGDAWGGG